MAGDTQITVVGNLTGDPELRFIQSGAAVVNFTVASTPRTFDRQSNEWKDGDTLFMRCSLWREAAENVAESLTKGMRVIVSGRLVSSVVGSKRREAHRYRDAGRRGWSVAPLRHRQGDANAARGRRRRRLLRWWRFVLASRWLGHRPVGIRPGVRRAALLNLHLLHVRKYTWLSPISASRARRSTR